MAARDIRVPVVRGRSRERIEQVASMLLALCAPECLREPTPAPMIRIFDRVLPGVFKFKPQVESLAYGLEALTDMAQMTVTLPPETYADLEDEQGRARFTVGHETGHVVLHRGELLQQSLSMAAHGGVVLARRKEIPAYSDPEWQSDNFAAALLMPPGALVALERTQGELTEEVLRDVFKVSATAACRRINTYENNRDMMMRVANVGLGFLCDVSRGESERSPANS